MALLENRAEVLALLREHEVALSELYTGYAERFPFHKEFWLKLAGEEMAHADSIDQLQAKIESGDAIYSVDKFRPVAVRSSINYIERQTEEARVGLIKMINALSVSLDLETAIIEKKYFDAVEGDTVEVKQILETVVEESIEHFQRIHDMWEKQKR